MTGEDGLWHFPVSAWAIYIFLLLLFYRVEAHWERAKKFPRLSKYLVIWADSGTESLPLCSCQCSQYLGCTLLSSWSRRIKVGIAEPRCFSYGMDYQKRLRVGGRRGQKYQTKHLTWKQRQVGAVEWVMDWCKRGPPSEQAHFLFCDLFASWWVNSWKSPQKLLPFYHISLYQNSATHGTF